MAHTIWRWRLRPKIIVLAFFLLGVAIICGAVGLPVGRGVDVVIVDMRVEGSSRAEFFWNSFEESPLWAGVIGGQRAAIEFHLPPTSLYRFRIDPTQKADDDILIYRLAVRFTDGSEVTIPLDAIAKWTFINTTTPILTDGALKFRSTNSDPYFFGTPELETIGWFDTLSSIVRKHVRVDEFVIQLILGGATLAALMSVAAFGAILLATTAAISFLLLYFGPATIQYIIGPDSYDVATAIGPAAFLGLSVVPSRLATVAAALLAAGLGFAVWTWFRSSAVAVGDRRVAEIEELKPPILSDWAVAVIWLLALIIVLIPDLGAIAYAKSMSSFAFHWDSNNVTTWAGLIAQGKRPYLDFWYPYYGLWIFDLPLPYGPLFRAFYEVVVFWTLGMGVWRLVGGRILIWLTTIALVVLLTKAGVVPLPERYLLALTVTLTYVAADRGAPIFRSGRWWFWIACALALWGEPVQLVYASPAVAVALVHDELRRERLSLHGAITRAVRDFGVPLACLIGLFSFLVWRGELGGFVESAMQTADSRIYGVMPTDLKIDLRNVMSIGSIGVFAPFILLIIGASAALAPSSSAERRLALAILCCGIIGVMVLQKHLLRPIGTQLLPPSLFGALLVFPLFSSRLRSQAFHAMIFGALAASIVLNDGLSSRGRDLIVDAYNRMASTYHVLTRNPKLIEDANKAAFAEARFPNFKQELAVIDKINATGKKSLFALTDMPIFYLFSAGPTPFHISHYSASPIRAQVALQTWLARTKPEIVVLDPTALTFDTTQLVVRVPLVAEEVIENYVPFERSGPYHLLVRRAADQPIPLAYWREILGPKIDYGYLLRYIRGAQLPSCPPVISDHSCVRYLELIFDSETATPQPLNLTVEVGSFDFQVSFVREPGMKSYFMPIDRLWFWRVGEAMRLTPRLHPDPGNPFTTTIVEKLPKRPTLY